MSILRCARCEDFTYEQLRTHGYCVNCNYSEDLFEEDSSPTLASVCRVVVHSKNKIEDRATQRFQAAVNERRAMEAEAC